MALGGTIRGKRTTLRTPMEDDLAAYNRWMADMRIRHLSRVWHEPAMPATWKERFTEQWKDKNSVLWSIESANALVGLVRFEFGWNERNYGWIDQFVIDPDRWQGAIGTDAALALHRYLFDYLDLRRVNTTIRADNVAGAKIAARLGYSEFAHGHDVFYRDGAYVDEAWLLMERATWDERWSSEREYAPLRGRTLPGAAVGAHAKGND
jgi:RimJ/RimL family protein N-acetyltransferase